MKQPKLKTCSFCKKDTVLWKSNPSACKPCWQREQAKTPKKSKSPARARISPISESKAKELKEYRILRDKFMSENQTCQVEGCNSPSEDLHHVRPRAFFLCDVEEFLAVCRLHHNFIHENDKWARENGYLKSKHKI